MIDWDSANVDCRLQSGDNETPTLPRPHLVRLGLPRHQRLRLPLLPWRPLRVESTLPPAETTAHKVLLPMCGEAAWRRHKKSPDPALRRNRTGAAALREATAPFHPRLNSPSYCRALTLLGRVPGAGWGCRRAQRGDCCCWNTLFFAVYRVGVGRGRAALGKTRS